jgi:hypothetical protein
MIDLASRIDVRGELSNIFHANLMHSDMEKREYDYGCYVRQGGRWEKYPITTMVTGLMHGTLGGIPVQVGGGSGHINRNGVVPMQVVRRTNVPIATMHTNAGMIRDLMLFI